MPSKARPIRLPSPSSTGPQLIEPELPPVISLVVIKKHTTRSFLLLSEVLAEILFTGGLYQVIRQIKFVIARHIFFQHALHGTYIIVMNGIAGVIAFCIAKAHPAW